MAPDPVRPAHRRAFAINVDITVFDTEASVDPEPEVNPDLSRVLATPQKGRRKRQHQLHGPAFVSEGASVIRLKRVEFPIHPTHGHAGDPRRIRRGHSPSEAVGHQRLDQRRLSVCR